MIHSLEKNRSRSTTLPSTVTHTNSSLFADTPPQQTNNNATTPAHTLCNTNYHNAISYALASKRMYVLEHLIKSCVHSPTSSEIDDMFMRTLHIIIPETCSPSFDDDDALSDITDISDHYPLFSITEQCKIITLFMTHHPQSTVLNTLLHYTDWTRAAMILYCLLKYPSDNHSITIVDSILTIHNALHLLQKTIDLSQDISINHDLYDRFAQYYEEENIPVPSITYREKFIEYLHHINIERIWPYMLTIYSNTSYYIFNYKFLRILPIIMDDYTQMPIIELLQLIFPAIHPTNNIAATRQKYVLSLLIKNKKISLLDKHITTFIYDNKLDGVVPHIYFYYCLSHTRYFLSCARMDMPHHTLAANTDITAICTLPTRKKHASPETSPTSSSSATVVPWEDDREQLSLG